MHKETISEKEVNISHELLNKVNVRKEKSESRVAGIYKKNAVLFNLK